MPDGGTRPLIVVERKKVTEPPIARIVLHGRLRKKFGAEFRVGASTISRAIHVISVLRPDFREALEEGSYRVIRGSVKRGVEIDERQLNMQLPPSGEFHLFPVAAGAKQGMGPAKIIVGLLLVVAAFVLPVAAGGLFGAAATGATAGTAGFVAGGGSLITAGTIFGVPVLSGLALFGGSLILGGISAILTQNAKRPTSSAESFMLGGQLNTSQQGVPVPIVYGTMMAGSVVVSMGYDTAAFALPRADIEQAQADQKISTQITPNNAVILDDGSAGYSGDLPLPPGVSGTGQSGGGGGKKGGGGGDDDPNTLRSDATVRIIDVISEGPIGGLVKGPQSIFFNGTPLQAADGTWNFKGVGWEFRRGLPNQAPVNGFPAAEQIVQVGVKIIHGNPVVETFHSDTATSLRVTMQIPALVDVDTKTGNMRKTVVSYTIEIRPSREADTGGFVGGYVRMFGENLYGKCTSPYEKSYHFALPGLDQGANVWDIRITRDTPNPTRATLSNDTIFLLYTIVTDHQLMYPDTAYIALTIDARSFALGAVPQRNYLVHGREILVPQNYDHVNRTYSSSGPGTNNGAWDAVSMVPAVGGSSNPAWVLYDMMTDQRYGAGAALNALEITRANLYMISQYSDGIVPDGFGGSEPRYQINAVISERVEAYTMFQTMVSAFRGMTYWGAGQVQIVCDMPKNPVKLVNQANVIDGNFAYQGSSLKTRHNMARVAWRNPDNYYHQEVEVFEMTGDISRRGMIPTDIIAFGCTSRSLARRLGKWLLYTENQQTEALQYDASLYQMSLRPGDVFQQSDPAYVGLRWAGRLRSVSTPSQLHLDSILSLGDGLSFTLTVVMPDDSVAEAPFAPGNVGVSADGSYSIIFLAPGNALPMQPQPNAEWIVLDNALDPRLFQAISISVTAPGRFQVSAIEHNPQKFDEIELGLTFRPQIFSKLPGMLLTALPPPSNVSAVDYLIGEGNTTIIRVTVSWSMPNDPRVDHAEVQAQSDNLLEIHQARGNSLDIDHLVPDTYVFSVRTVSKTGGVSGWVSTTDVVVDGKSDPPEAVTGLLAIGGTRRVQLSWDPGTRRDLKYYEVQRAPAVGSFPDVSDPFSPGHFNQGAPGSFAFVAFVGGTSFVDAASDLLFPNTVWWYRVRAVTTTDVLGDFSQPAWGLTTMLIVDDLADGIIDTAKFAQTIKPVGLVTDLSKPGLQGDVVYNETDGQLYKFDAGAWKPIIDLGSITGELDSAKIKSLEASKIDGQISSEQIASLAVAKISGDIQANQIAAGAITAEKLAISSSSNLIWNSCCEQAGDGWTFVAYPGPVSGSGTTKGTAYDPTWRLAGFGCGYVTIAGTLATDGSQYMQVLWDPNVADAGNPLGIPFPPNIAIEGQARVQGHRCAVHTQIDFFNAGGVYISSLIGTRVVTPGPIDGKTLSHYQGSWVHGVSPSNCARARFSIIGWNDGNTDIDPQTTQPYLFFTQAAVGASMVSATEPAPWAPGGVTTITGPMIKTGTIQTAQLAAGGIDADRLVARSITAAKIQALAITANELSANSVTLGKVAAGAIGATEIAAEQIKATHLAADFALATSAQIGSLTVDTLNLKHGSISFSAMADTWQQQSTSITVYCADAGQTVILMIYAMDGGFVDVLEGAGGDYPVDRLFNAVARVRRNGLDLQYDIDFPPAGWNTYTISYDTGGQTYNTGNFIVVWDWYRDMRPNAGRTLFGLMQYKR